MRNPASGPGNRANLEAGRISRVVLARHAGFCFGVRRAVDGFVKEEEQFDDLTMLCLAYRGSAEDICLKEE